MMSDLKSAPDGLWHAGKPILLVMDEDYYVRMNKLKYHTNK
jgi:hypothetical protein